MNHMHEPFLRFNNIVTYSICVVKNLDRSLWGGEREEKESDGEKWLKRDRENRI